MSIYDNFIQGSFVSTGAVANLNIRSDVDYIQVDNYTQWAAQTPGVGFRFSWQRGMPQGSAFQEAVDVDNVGSQAQLSNKSDQSVAAHTTSGTGAVTFDTNTVLGSGFTHTVGTAGLTVLKAGIYRFEFDVSGAEANQFQIYVNNVAVAGTTFGSGATLQQNTGFGFLTLAANDVVTVVNSTSAGAITLAGTTPIGGTNADNSNASLSLELISSVAMDDSLLLSNGFTLIDSSKNIPGPQLSGTAISSATPPVASSAATSTLANGSIVRLYNIVGGNEFAGMDFSVDTVVANTSFHLPFAPTIVAATTFNYRIIPYQPMFYPPRRFITAITSSGITTVVKLSVTHAFTVGQEMVFSTIPAMYGMTQISGLRGKIIAIDTTLNTVTLDLDSSSFTPFAFPVTAVAAAAHTQPQLIPWGDGLDVSQPLQTSATLAGSTKNEAFIGISLGAGANGPAGQANDVIYWRAWKASQIQTTVQTYP